jgi:hypothetical protein
MVFATRAAPDSNPPKSRLLLRLDFEMSFVFLWLRAIPIAAMLRCEIAERPIAARQSAE